MSLAPSFTAAVTDLAFLICLVLAMFFCFALAPAPKSHGAFKNFFLLFIGLICGCIAAVLAIPFDPVDVALYAPISNALGLLLTGYIAGKVGSIAKNTLQRGNTIDWTNVGYLAFFLIGAALSATVIVVNRTEWIAQAVRCDPQFYARSVPEELRKKMQSDQRACDQLGIRSSTSQTLPIPAYTNLNVAPYKMAYIQTLPWQTLPPTGQCVYNVKFTGSPGLWLECKTAGTDSRHSEKTTGPESNEPAK